MRSPSSPDQRNDSTVFVQLAILGALLAGLVFLHKYSQNASAELDPTAMLALGFVVLASYTIGGLAEVIKLPHITGYLIAGLVFGPSAATALQGVVKGFGYELVSPLQQGILNAQVIDQLSLLDTLAIALIAITAGGELKLDALRKGLSAILGILGFQFLTVMGLVTAYVVLVSGPIPGFTLPGLGSIGIPEAAAIGVMLAAIAFATSPAATIAVITETKARGPMSSTVLSTVVLKDVVVVIAFGVAKAFALALLYKTAEGGLAGALSREIFGSLALGAATGLAVAAYLAYVGQELLIFIVAVVYTVAFIAGERLHLDIVIVFLAAGFTVSNFSKHGHQLIESVERLSLPVYVVFFTLAGAKLHLDDLAKVFVFAAGLVIVRMIAIWLGVRAGAKVGRADEGTKQFGWLGFVSQAGVAITLAAVVGNEFGEIGSALETLIIGGVALNELLGPIMFKMGLGLAGETDRAGEDDEDPSGHLSVAAPSIVTESDAEGATPKLTAWPAQIGGENLWRTPLDTKSKELGTHVRGLSADLQGVVRDLSTGALQEFREDAEKYIRDLRRDFLRHHRRLAVQSRASAESDRDALGTMLRAAQSDLAAHWRGIVLGRSITLGKQVWSPVQLVDDIDAIVDALPETVRVPYEDSSYVDKEDESVWQSAQRIALRLSRRSRNALGQAPPQRDIELRGLARYHISYAAPTKLEGLAALFVEAERHLVARTRSIFDGVAAGYDDIARAASNNEDDVDLERQLSALRSDVEEELSLALEEVERISADGTNRAARALTGGLNEFKEDLPTFGTMDLPASQRRTSKRFAQRIRAVERLGSDLGYLRKASATQYSMLAMELELLGLEAKVKDAVEEQVGRLDNMLRRRAVAQAERVDEVLRETLLLVEQELREEHTGEQLAGALRAVTENANKVTGEAARVSAQLFAELSDETRFAPLLDELIEACRGLTPRYRVIAGQWQTGEWRLPTGLPQMEIPFREAVITYIESRVAPQLLATTKNVAERVQPLANLLQEIERLIAFNVELATAELEAVHDEPVPDQMDSLLRELVTGQLERGQAQLADILENATTWPDDLASGMRNAAMGNLRSLRDDLADGSFSRARLDAIRRAAGGSGLVGGSLRGRISELGAQVRTGLRTVIGERRFRAWRERFGRDPSATSELLSDAFAAPAPETELPMVYRRLFAADTMEAGDVLTGRESEIQRAEAVLSSEARGRLRSVALVGPDGVGKAAVAAAIIRARRWKNVRRISWDAHVTQEDLDAVFVDAADGQLVVVDGLHWLVSLEPGGFEPLRRFVAGIIAENGKRRWLTFGDRLFWNFASTIAPLSDAFPEKVLLEPLQPEALEAAVIARHRLSGYGHAFDRPEGRGLLDQFLTRGANRLRRPYEQYFQDLHEETGGLVRDALRLWLASIEDVQDGEVVRLGPVPRSAIERLERLPEDVLVNLYQVARAGSMNARAQARLFRIDESSAQAQLSRFAHLGLVTEENGEFRVAAHLRGSLGRIFAERGWTR